MINILCEEEEVILKPGGRNHIRTIDKSPAETIVRTTDASHQSTMSAMLSWFTGSGGQKRKAAPKDAIVALRAHLEMLQKREQHLQNQMDEQEAIARRNVSSNKTGVLLSILFGFV